MDIHWQGCDQCSPAQGWSTVYFTCHQSDLAHSVCLKLVDECKDEQNAPLVDEIFNILVQGAGKGKKGMFGRHFHEH